MDELGRTRRRGDPPTTCAGNSALIVERRDKRIAVNQLIFEDASAWSKPSAWVSMVLGSIGWRHWSAVRQPANRSVMVVRRWGDPGASNCVHSFRARIGRVIEPRRYNRIVCEGSDERAF